MSQEQQIVELCRSAIKSLLWEHVKFPLLNMREEDFRSSLLLKLRNLIKGSVSVRLKKDKDDGLLSMGDACNEKTITSRVHSEVRLIKKSMKRKANKKDCQTYDIVVLKNRPVVFRVRQSGVDVVEKLELEDVSVVIEIKAAPSNRQHKKFEEDIGKLKRLGCAKRIFVAIDKSISLGMPHIGSKKPNNVWQKGSRKLTKRAKDVEVWFLDDNEEPANVLR